MKEVFNDLVAGLADLIVNYPRMAGFSAACLALLGFLIFGAAADLSNVAPR